MTMRADAIEEDRLWGLGFGSKVWDLTMRADAIEE